MTRNEALTNTFCLLGFLNLVSNMIESFSQLSFPKEELNLEDVSLEDDTSICGFADRFYLSKILLCCPELVPAFESVTSSIHYSSDDITGEEPSAIVSLLQRQGMSDRDVKSSMEQGCSAVAFLVLLRICLLLLACTQLAILCLEDLVSKPSSRGCDALYCSIALLGKLGLCCVSNQQLDER